MTTTSKVAQQVRDFFYPGTDFNCDAITADIVAAYGDDVVVDSIPQAEFAEIARRHDVSAISIPVQPPAAADHGEREAFIRDLYAVAAFFSAHPELPVPSGTTMFAFVDDRETVAKVAVQLGRRTYKRGGVDDGQTDVDVDGTAGRMNLIVAVRK